jgi:hypothetical protein
LTFVVGLFDARKYDATISEDYNNVNNRACNCFFTGQNKLTSSSAATK